MPEIQDLSRMVDDLALQMVFDPAEQPVNRADWIDTVRKIESTAKARGVPELTLAAAELASAVERAADGNHAGNGAALQDCLARLQQAIESADKGAPPPPAQDPELMQDFI